ncbi:unnamed protein product [Ostreobium quekettii]|uniref:Acyl-coenzyme A oxidase n=1 Tax=Ostreobium quekettii TaxID=121088 RepID=A0A8S1ITZ1_9CHLO|nr:unnamed protein product [Ostreobium quekettii]|eukprot:evm.model.scf_215EXC.4 EVM.evm.TU.scf_215EXC.4   scf_215EXC:44789-50896(-)
MAHFVDARTRVLQEESTKAVLSNCSDPKADLAAERARATFDVGELLHYLNGGREKVERKAHFAELISRTEWGNKSERYFQTREEQYVHGLKVAFGIWDFMKEKRLGISDGRVLRSLVNAPGGLELHIGMFIPSLISHANPEQQAKWLPKAQSLEIIGTYAQTELGHGTFVRGLETTATYDSDRQEFIVHSPTLTSTKWWPGGLGKTATHIILMARLFTKGKDYGPHAFIMQIRSLEDHKPLTGITIGDIGPKFGFNGVDNGFLRLEYVRIPREAMLMRFAKITPEGDYVPPPPANAKASYATMMYVRSTIVQDAGKFLSMAVTIATRYTSVRRQTTSSKGQRETQVLDYQSVAGSLLPLLATAYALHFTGKVMMQMYTDFERSRDRGDFSNLPELHAFSSGLKAMCTTITSEGIEKSRLLCGGHGYSRLSGLPDMYTSYVQNSTWEGDNNVMFLQTGRYLIKSLLGAMTGKTLSGYAKYLENAQFEMKERCNVSTEVQWLDPAAQLAAFRNRAARLCVDAAEQLKQESGGNPVFEGEPWDNSNVIVIKLAVAHSQYVIYKNFMDSLQGIRSRGELQPNTVRALADLQGLFGLTVLEREVGDMLESGYLSARQVKLLRAQQRALVKAVRPNAVPLVDAFGFLDYELSSALGRSDGDVYRGLLEMAQASPLNRTEEGPGWKAVLEAQMKKPGSRSRL